MRPFTVNFFFTMKKLIITKLLVLNIVFVFAQAPNGYYSSANGKSDNALRIALQEIIKGHTILSYTPGLWNLFQYSDVTSDGKIWDMYSTCDWIYSISQCGNYTNVCDCYNREHSVPQSWFGSASPMNTDAFHIYPTDGRVNAHHDNFPYGECTGGIKIDNNKQLGRLGISTFAGYASIGTVFEPDDEYKGDFARTYFYMATRYADVNFNRDSQNFGEKVFGNANNGLTNYAVALFLKWHKNDPVSDKEINRNNVIYAHQHNRNPFIDHPELAEYIWGDSISYFWNNGGASAVDEIDFFKPEISPNPTSDFISVNNNDFFHNFDYQIFTIQGKIVLNGNSFVNQQIDISVISKGIYFIKISTENCFFVEKIIKK